ncbi:VCBS repeat-containing protein [Streptomyces sp. NBC_00250]|uniref:VCBS repeat-containing protein n=1 Tax=Streptomyces sp. NBC_00250 TaxID=2903641 RepID=UPI002E2E6A2C|nr:VCBS repeat-containing protein [Streptomyces sp. NBC_00250]
MQHRSSARRLTAAVTVVLAVTAGAAVTVAPATAAPVAGPAAAQKTGVTAPIIVDNDIQVLSAGTTGFLSRRTVNENSEYRWTSYADGSTKILDADTAFFGGGSDVVFMRKATEDTYYVRDMANPTSYLYGISGSGYILAGVAGRTLVMTRRESSGELDVVLKRLSPGSGSAITLDVPLPTDARILRAQAATLDTALILYARGTGDETEHHLAAVDLATGRIAETVALGTSAPRTGVFLTDSHFAWVDNPTGTAARLVTVARGGGGDRSSFPLGTTPTGAALDAAPVGGWAITVQKGGGLSEYPSAQYPLVARSLTAPGSTVKLLDHVDSMTAAPDGSVLVRGGSLADGGEGVYKIAPGEGGTPVATRVATTGRKTELDLASSSVPPVVDLDANGGRAALTWTLSRYNAEGTVTLRHVATGRKTQRSFSGHNYSFRVSGGKITFDWDGLAAQNVGDLAAFAPNGDYVWELRAKPLNGIGPDLARTGTFKVARKAGPHDYTDNGSPDLLARDASGRLFRDDTVKTWASSEVYSVGRAQIGTGWQIYNQLEAVGNLAGGTAGDLVARDKDGVLWQYLGKGDGTFAPRTKIGSGWNAYDKITGGSDLNGDGKSDLLATDTSGSLWYYRGTGDWKAPFATRVRLGGGWGIYNQITAVGNLAGSAAGDLVARDTSGVLWLYQGDGSGKFTTRVKIGTGWGGFTHLVAAGDADRDGRVDLYAAGPSGSRLYTGTGDATSPFKPGVFTSVHSDAARFDSVF